ncbi:DUF5050 domain-containing protein [Exiguobacterium alkaliphilum]|uniref:DUF5050 domain-containing protein n=1 Tax=Exiguobacterium alkaliphilum TaxID=1428684 RepID=A0ABT2KUZ0_9BACL|nr:DUF5050 domain-containing protein [Exiguobacterium alkaliphilum]MCT4794793.1 DUF5050 domain-containing protein [Exiguobacterium alkaliphilum]
MDASDVRAAESKIPHVKDVRMYGCKQEFSRPNFSIYLQDGSGNSIKKIGDALKDGCEKMLSNPDGQRLYYSSMNATNLYTIQTNGKNLRKITPSVKGYGFELLDAKKNRVFYSYAAQKGGYPLESVDASGKNRIQYTNRYYAYKVHGNSVYFSDEANTNRLYRIGIDGKGKRMITVDREIQDIDVAPGFVFYTRINPRNKNQVQLVRVSLDGQQKDVITTWKQGHQHYTIHQGMLYYLEEGTTFKSNGSPYVRYAFKRMKPDGNLTGKREIIRTIPLLAYGSETLVFKPFGMAYEKFDSEKIAEYVVVPYNPKQTTYTFEADRYNWYE